MLAWLRMMVQRVRGALHRAGIDREFTEELRAHAEMLADENMRSGMSAEEARRQAALKLGNASRVREDYRDQAGLPFLEVLWQDLRYGVRTLRKAPAFAAVATITLALGIGANSAIFSVVNGVLLRPLPYEDPAHLMFTYNTAPAKGMDNYGTSPPDFRALREGNRTLASLSAFYSASFNLTGTDRPERLRGQVVSAEYFTTLGVKPVLGRGFLASEERWGSHHVVVVSNQFWRSHLNADPNIQGRPLHLNGESYSVVGILPANFYTFRSMDVWVPMAWKPKDDLNSHNNYFLNMIGRLKPGVSRDQARTDLNSIMLAIAQQFPENKGIGAALKPLHEVWVGDVRPALVVLLGAVAFVLLIACVNLANLMLARSAGRQKEIAIRSALGAGRRRLLRQFMTESILLSLIGGVVGLGLAYFCLDLLPLAKNILPRMQEIRLDAWVLLFTLVVSILTGIIFGLMPALQNSRVRQLNDVLKEGGRTTETAGARVRRGLVVSEIALALVLLICAGLALKSFSRLLRVDSGFDPAHVLTFNVNLPQAYYEDQDPLRNGAPPRVAGFFRSFLARVEQMPGVKSAGMVSNLPFQGENWGKYFVPLDRPLPASIDAIALVQYRAVAGHVFNAMGIRLIKGRLLDEHDQANTQLSVVVNETMARRFWPGQDPIGKVVLLTPPENLIPPADIPPGYHPPQFTVVGVVSDVRYGGLDQSPQPAVYASIFQHDFSFNPFITVRAEVDPMTLAASIRAELAQLDKTLPMASISTMEEVLSESVAQPRLEALLLGLFGGLALVLAAIGIYGVMSYMVTRRTSEIGIRMALGASRSAVLQMVIGEGVRLAAIGLAAGLTAGLALAFAVKRVTANLLFGVSTTDPATFVAIAALLALVALLACFIPARRATKVDPMVALRYE